MSDADVPITPPVEQLRIKMRNLVWSLVAIGIMAVAAELQRLSA